jgi:membrane protease YdiL (CAAX protease family)
VTNVRLAWWSTFVGVLAVIAYWGRLSSGQPDRNVLYKWSTPVGALVQYALMLFIVLLIAGWRREPLALRRPRSWPRALLLMPVVLVAIWVSVTALDPLLHGGREQGLTPTRWEPGHAGAYIASFVVIAVVAPFVEEVTFRGLGYTLVSPYGVWLAIVVTGAAFALAHGLVQAFPELLIFGCALGWLRSRTDSVYPGMILHGLFNGITLIAAVTIGGN